MWSREIMKTPLISLMLVVFVAVMAVPVHADTFDPVIWYQSPDLSQEGLAVRSTFPWLLADDFLSTSTDPIIQIVVWGVWQDDLPPDPSLLSFYVGIFEDIPDWDQEGPAFSMPGDLVWEDIFLPGEFGEFIAENVGGQFWYDSQTGDLIDDSHQQLWTYSFNIDLASNPFIRQGTPEDARKYWLTVGADVSCTRLFGWQSSGDHWLDSAVWIDLSHPDAAQWQPVIPPFGSGAMDLAFALIAIPEPTTLGLIVLGGLMLRKRRRGRHA